MEVRGWLTVSSSAPQQFYLLQRITIGDNRHRKRALFFVRCFEVVLPEKPPRMVKKLERAEKA